VTPLTVKSYAIGLVDDWVARGLSTDRDTIIEAITAEINSGNAGRIDLLIPDVPSAGLRILAAKLEWAFLV
jgi:phage tail sheath gpL-like